MMTDLGILIFHLELKDLTGVSVTLEMHGSKTIPTFMIQIKS